jgi:hypothetical protein
MLTQHREWWSVWRAILLGLLAAGFLGNLASRPSGPTLDVLPSRPAQESLLPEPRDGPGAGDLSPMKEPLQFACRIHEPMGHNVP